MSSSQIQAAKKSVTIHSANRLGLDYAAQAMSLGTPIVPIIDVHSHIGGREASKIYAKLAKQYGISLTYSMTQLEQIEFVRDVLGDRVRFIAVPNYNHEDRLYHHGRGYTERISEFHKQGARIAKFWAAPRAIDYGIEIGEPDLLRINSKQRLETMHAAAEVGMIFMTHIADPNTWFKAKYTDASVYGTKLQQYEPFEELLDQFKIPWIAAHMGGFPEDLDFLAQLMSRHDNLYLDTSAGKWMVRELSKHSREDLLAFLQKFKGRVMFGSDILTSDDHLTASDQDNEMQAKASTSAEAYDLYASRYWALRTLFETDYDGESPIADPDLAMVDPQQFDEMDAPQLVGKSLPADILKSLYHDAAHDLLEPLHKS